METVGSIGRDSARCTIMNQSSTESKKTARRVVFCTRGAWERGMVPRKLGRSTLGITSSPSRYETLTLRNRHKPDPIFDILLLVYNSSFHCCLPGTRGVYNEIDRCISPGNSVYHQIEMYGYVPVSERYLRNTANGVIAKGPTGRLVIKGSLCIRLEAAFRPYHIV